MNLMNRIRLLCLLGAIVFALGSCSDESTAPEFPQERTFRNVSFEDIPGVISQLTTNLGLTNGDGELSTLNGETEVLLDIDWENIIELTDSMNQVSYTFAVHEKNNIDPYSFHNLIISKTPEGNFKRPYLLTYEMDEAFKAVFRSTRSMKGFTGTVIKRYFDDNVWTTPRGSSSDPYDVDPRSTGGDPCDTANPVGTQSSGDPGGNDGGDNDGSSGSTGTICTSYWIDFPSELCPGVACVTAPPSILVTECYDVGPSNSSSDSSSPCSNDDEVAIIVPTINIILDDLCLTAVANRLINGNVMNDLNQAIQEIFNYDDNYNLTIEEDPSLEVAGRTYPVENSGDGSLNVVILLNPDILRNTSQEYIGYIIYHEAIHAFLEGIGQTSPQIAEHYSIATEYMDWFSEAMLEVFPDLTQRQAIAFGLRGVTDIREANATLYNSLLNYYGFADEDAVLSETEPFADGTGGTNCRR